MKKPKLEFGMMDMQLKAFLIGNGWLFEQRVTNCWRFVYPSEPIELYTIKIFDNDKFVYVYCGGLLLFTFKAMQYDINPIYSFLRTPKTGAEANQQTMNCLKPQKIKY